MGFVMAIGDNIIVMSCQFLFHVFPDFVHAKCVRVSLHSRCFTVLRVSYLFAVLAGVCILVLLINYLFLGFSRVTFIVAVLSRLYQKVYCSLFYCDQCTCFQVPI